MTYVDAVDEDDDREGSEPYVQLCAFGEGQVQVEAVSNHYLDPRHRLSGAQQIQLGELGWQAPSDEPGGENFHEEFERREADRVAVLLVRSLREVYGVPHPAFLAADGLETDPTSSVLPTGGGGPVEGQDDATTFPTGHEHLQAMVDEAMEQVFPDLVHDGDGDIPISAGSSVLFVRVLEDRPSVELFSELVLQVSDVDRARLELEILNAAHPLWKFVLRNNTVVMRHELVALPFSPFLLRMTVHHYVEEVDEIARMLALRVGGHRFYEVPPDSDEMDVVTGPMDGLLELLHLGCVRPSTVAALFDHDRLEIIRQLVLVRTGVQSCEGHDEEQVLDVLRKALRFVSDGKRVRPQTVPLPPKPRSRQSAMSSDLDAAESPLEELDWPS